MMNRSGYFRLLIVALAACFAASGVHAAEDAGRKLARGYFCTECHGETGVSTNGVIPHLAGQDATYLKRQLKLFSTRSTTGVRAHPVMNVMAGLPDVSARDQIAKYFAAQSCGSQAATKRVSRPRRADRCDACHGAEGRGGSQGVPRLAGQQRAYLMRQLKLFFRTAEAGGRTTKGGTYRRHYPTMTREADRLGEAEIPVLASYYAGLSCRK